MSIISFAFKGHITCQLPPHTLLEWLLYPCMSMYCTKQGEIDHGQYLPMVEMLWITQAALSSLLVSAKDKNSTKTRCAYITCSKDKSPTERRTFHLTSSLESIMCMSSECKMRTHRDFRQEKWQSHSRVPWVLVLR